MSATLKGYEQNIELQHWFGRIKERERKRETREWEREESTHILT